MTKLEIVQRKIQELKLYKKYLLKLKTLNSLNNVYDKKQTTIKKQKKIK